MIPTYQNHRCLVRESLKVRSLLNKQFEALNLTSRAIMSDAKDNGRKFTESSLSKYRKHGNVNGALSTPDIMWLCDKYKIKLKLTVTKK